MLNRCDKCGGLISGRHNGFEAVCRCYGVSKNKRKQIFHAKEPRFRHPDEDEVKDIVNGVIGVETD